MGTQRKSPGAGSASGSFNSSSGSAEFTPHNENDQVTDFVHVGAAAYRVVKRVATQSQLAAFAAEAKREAFRRQWGATDFVDSPPDVTRERVRKWQETERPPKPAV